MDVVPEQDKDIPCHTRERVYELIKSPGTDVINVIFPKDCVAYSEENVSTGKNFKFAIAVDCP